MSAKTTMSNSFNVNIFGSFISTTIPDEFDACFSGAILIDRRNSTPMEMDGYSLYLALKALDSKAPSQFKTARMRIVKAILDRAEQCGGFFIHGAWTNSDEEVHYRFTAAAIRLLVQAYRDGLVSDPLPLRKIVMTHHETQEKIALGVWFLHDSLELKGTKTPYPHPLVKNSAWGSSQKNNLVLNTHIDTIVTLIDCLNTDILHQTQKLTVIKNVKSAIQLLDIVLTENNNFVWKIFATMDHHLRTLLFLSEQHQNFFARKFRGIIKKAYFPLRTRIRIKYPSYFFADGYSERDLGLMGTSFEYHLVNIHDLARLKIQVQQSPSFTECKKSIPHWNVLIDRMLDYASSRPYATQIIASTKLSGRAILFCEAIILRLTYDREFSMPNRWLDLFFKVRKLTAATPAFLGYDPFVVSCAWSQSLDLAGIEKLELLDGRKLTINHAEEKFDLED